MVIHFKYSTVYFPTAIFNPCGDLQKNLPSLKYHEWLSVSCNSKISCQHYLILGSYKMAKDCQLTLDNET